MNAEHAVMGAERTVPSAPFTSNTPFPGRIT